MSAFKEAIVVSVGFAIGQTGYGVVTGHAWTGHWYLAGLLGAFCTETIAQLYIRRPRA